MSFFNFTGICKIVTQNLLTSVLNNILSNKIVRLILPSDADRGLSHYLYKKYCCLRHWTLKELLLDPLPEEHLQLETKEIKF